jgi:hypothetical protein
LAGHAVIEVIIPMKIDSVANLREHWRKRSARAKMQRAWARVLSPPHELPCIVTLVRVAPRELDGDNLQYAFKAVRDGVADRLGIKDNDPRVEWLYGQQKGPAKHYETLIRICAA